MFRSFFVSVRLLIVFRSFVCLDSFVRSFASIVRSFVRLVRSFGLFVRLRKRTNADLNRLRKLPNDSECTLM